MAIIQTLNWPAPANIVAGYTNRIDGASVTPFESFNMGDHVGDDLVAVTANRAKLTQAIGLSRPWPWLNQTHSTRVVEAFELETGTEADASFTRQINQPCVVMTADCLPILLCDQQATVVAAVHAGWRGLADGIVRNTLFSMDVDATQLMAYFCPAISQIHFEVGQDVVERFQNGAIDAAHRQQIATAFYKGSKADKWFADMYRLATLELNTLGVTQVFGGDACTFADHRFYSYRRDGVTGRMASFIGITQ